MAGRGIVIKIEGDGESARRALEMFREQMERAGETAKHEGGAIAQAMERVKVALEFAGVYEGLRMLREGLQELVIGSLEFGEAMERTSRNTGLAIGTLSVLHYAAAVTGNDFEALTSAVSKMDATIGAATEGNKKAEAFMRGLGLNAKELAGQSDGAEIAFKKLAQTIAATENPIRQVELAKGVLGKAGAAEVSMLIELGEHYDEYKAKAQAAGVYLDQDHARILAETNQKLNDMKQHVTGAGIAFTEGLTPGLQKMLSTISGGKSQMEAMTTFGRDTARVMELAAAAAFGLAAGWNAMWGSLEFGSAMRRDMADAEKFGKLAAQMRDLAMAKDDGFVPTPTSTTPEPSHPHGHGFTGTGDLGQAGKEDPFLRGQAANLDAYAKQRAALQKAAAESELAFYEAQHKLLLMSDEQFYAEKLRLERDSIKTEEDSVVEQIANLTALQRKQHNEKGVKRDKDGRSAAEIETATKLIDLNTILGQLQEKSNRLTTADALGQQERVNQQKLSTAQLAAKVEEETNTTITARLALLRLENELALQKIEATSGKNSPEYKQQQELERVMEAKLRIADVDRQIRQSEDDNARAVKELSDAAEKDPRFKKAATAEINALNKAEADQLRNLVQQYDALAQELGGPFLETAKNLHAEIRKLSTPDNRDQAAFAKTLAEGVESMADRVVESAARGKAGFRSMAQGMIDDMTRLMLKVAEQRWLTPLLMNIGAGSGSGVPNVPDSMFGALGEHHLSGGLSSGGPQVIGEEGPEIWTPPQRGGTVTPNNMISKLAESGGGGAKGINVVSNVINQTSAPVSAQPAQVSFNSDLKQFVIQTVLEDHASGGPTSALGSAGQ